MVGEEPPVSTPEPTKIGFILPTGYWLGGKNYLRNLFAAIRALPDNTITPIIFTGTQQKDAAANFPGTKIVTTSMLDRKSPLWLLRKAMSVASSHDVLLLRLLQRHNIAVLSHSFHLGAQSAIKTIGWIPDFQHVNLPEFFTPEERSRRDRDFRSICQICDKVIVSSECARADLQSFAPEHGHKAELLRFVANPVPIGSALSLPDLEEHYGFKGPYFLLPNQFWAHKNHRAVIGALASLKRRGTQLLVLATGSSDDYRNPSFFPSLMQYAADSDVLDCFRVLGQIPYDHLTGLMQHAVAFINPSRFEGWSTSVEEAKSMGKQIVLSDIPVHREQAPERGFYFPPEDLDALADALLAAYNGFEQKRDTELQNEARLRFPGRQREFGEAYRRIIFGTL